MVPKDVQRGQIARDRVIGEEASYDLTKPSPLFGDRLVHTPSQFLLDCPKLRLHAIAPGFPQDEELALIVALTDEGEPKEVEGLRFAEPALCPPVCSKAAELDHAGLVRIKRQRKLFEPLAHIVPEAAGVRLLLEADNNVISIAHENHITRGL